MFKTATLSAAAVALLAGAGAAQAKDARCINTNLPVDWIRIWDLELGETDLDKVGGLPCDKNWDRTPSDDSVPVDIQNSIGELLIAKDGVMDTLEVMGTNGDADVYYCEDGLRWFSVDQYGGCTLKDGKRFKYKGKTYKNTSPNSKGDYKYVDSVKATVSYVCNGQARIRRIGVSYSAVVKHDQCS